MAYINSEIIMKHSYKYIFLALFTLFSNAQAVSITEIQSGISVYANNVISNSGNFLDQGFSRSNLTAYITGAELETAVADGTGVLETYAFSNVAHEASGTINDAYIDLSFASSIYNGVDADLVLFFAGTGTQFSDGHTEAFQFSIDVGGISLNSNALMGVTPTTTVYNENDGILDNEFYASYAMIDLDGFGFDRTTPLGDIRVYLGDSSMPALAAVGAYHATVVPLPLSAVLFGSGLALLGWIGRKKSA